MTLYTFAWDVDGAWWQGDIPDCPECGEQLCWAPWLHRRVPISTPENDPRVECQCCGANYRVSGETVEIPTEAK